MVTQAQLWDLFDYCEKGYLVRKKSGQGPSNKAGSIVGYIPKFKTRNNRYVTTAINKQHYCVHKLIYMYHHGYMPEQLDHINRDTLDNRIENLREATSSENAQNRKLFANNSSGAKGVSWSERNKAWFVYVNVKKRRKNVGYFRDFELAHLVAIEAREKYHGAYTNHV